MEMNNFCNDEKVSIKGGRINIDNDIFSLSPRDREFSDGNLSIMLCAHKKYNLGDSQIDIDNFNSWKEVYTYIKEDLGGIYIAPLYLYDHSGLSISIGEFGIADNVAAWDSGCIGYIYTTDELIKELAVENTEESIYNNYKAEIDNCNAYINGETYRVEFVEDGELIEFVGNIFGRENAECIAEDFKKMFIDN